MRPGDKAALILAVASGFGILFQMASYAKQGGDIEVVAISPKVSSPTPDGLHALSQEAVDGAISRSIFAADRHVDNPAFTLQSGSKLVGVLHSGRRKLAVFEATDGQTSIVTENAVIEGWTIVKVEPSDVLMKHGEETKKIDLNGVVKGAKDGHP